jgi:hypothetical protein
MTAAQHRRVRLIWAAFAALWLVVSLGGLWWPWINVYITPKGGWVWCLIGAGYHHGWLQAHRELTPSEPLLDFEAALAIRRLALKPGDLLAVTTDHPLTEQAAAQIRDRLDVWFPDHAVVVLDNARLTIIEPEPICSACGQPYPAIDQMSGSERCHTCRHDEMIEQEPDSDAL